MFRAAGAGAAGGAAGPGEAATAGGGSVDDVWAGRLIRSDKFSSENALQLQGIFFGSLICLNVQFPHGASPTAISKHYLLLRCLYLQIISVVEMGKQIWSDKQELAFITFRILKNYCHLECTGLSFAWEVGACAFCWCRSSRLRLTKEQFHAEKL